MIYYTLLLFLLSASKMQVQLMFNIETDLDILQTSVKVRGCVTNLGFPRFIGSLHRRNWEQHSRHRHLRGLAHTDSAGVEWSDVSINRPAQQRTCQRSAFFLGGVGFWQVTNPVTLRFWTQPLWRAPGISIMKQIPGALAQLSQLSQLC